MSRKPSHIGTLKYVESEAKGESVKHVEKVKEEIVIGGVYEIWDVTTDQDRWWVITNLTNLTLSGTFRTWIIRFLSTSA